MAIAALHIAGALAGTFGLWLLTIFIGAWEQERYERARRQDIALALRVPVTSLDTAAVAPQILIYTTERFSRDLLRNRVADFCGVLRTGWGWLGSIVQVVVIAAVGWQTYTHGPESAVVMWSVLPIAIFFWLASVALSYTCLLFTGRHPGEPQRARSAIANYIDHMPAGSEGVAH